MSKASQTPQANRTSQFSEEQKSKIIAELKAIRRIHGLSFQGLASLLGTPYKTLQREMTGTPTMGLDFGQYERFLSRPDRRQRPLPLLHMPDWKLHK